MAFVNHPIEYEVIRNFENPKMKKFFPLGMRVKMDYITLDNDLVYKLSNNGHKHTVTKPKGQIVAIKVYNSEGCGFSENEIKNEIGYMPFNKWLKEVKN